MSLTINVVLWGLIPLFLLSVGNLASADPIALIRVGHVTCSPVPDVGAQGCPTTETSQVRLRVINSMGFDNGIEEMADLLDVNLNLESERGALAFHFDVVPTGVVFTDPFDREFFTSLTGLSLSATLDRTTFHFRGTGDTFTASSAVVSASVSQFPPPLDIFAQGTISQAPVPEPATLLLLGAGALGALATRGRRR